LLIVGLMAFGQAPRLARAADDGLLVETIETGALQATGEAVETRERKQRRNRTPLSMPYFSFAQSLRPGS
jgi:hypothetical protein